MQQQELIIVGIGASAGGLEALQAFVGNLPVEPGMAFLVVTHLDPSRPSAMVELLRRSGPLRVETANDGDTPEINTMYVSPPGVQLELFRGRLRTKPDGKTGSHPIDSLFRTLADELGPRAIAVVLSGTGSDGSTGLEAVRAAGGTTFAQDQSANFPGMPRSAIDRGVVDRVLPPTKIAEELVALRDTPILKPLDSESAPDPANPGEREPALAEILAVVRSQRNLDFSGYKTPTLLRRVHRRMVFRQVDSSREYLRLLTDESAEVDALVNDILINVTEFFRDAEVFEVLADQVLPRFDNRDPQHPLRIWVVGCSTGQEVYSIAMTVLEHQSETGKRFPIKLFATDIDEAALQVARTGCYSAEQCDTLSAARRKQFFVSVPGGLQIHKSVRDLCVFARHDVTQDPPFSRIDLITCRNVLIYFDADLQRHVIPFFHYALHPGGVLLLGKAESIGSFEALFDVMDADHRIYVSRAGSRERIPDMPARPLPMAPSVGDDHRASPATGDLRERQADDFLLAHYAPPAVVLDEELRVTEFRGDTSAFLVHNSGAASFNILKLARSDLLAQLSDALEVAKQHGECVRENVRVRGPDRDVVTNLRVVRFQGSVNGYLVLFETKTHSATRTPTPKLAAVANSYKRRLMLALERRGEKGDPGVLVHGAELETTRRRLHELIDEHEAKTEELKAANEEVVSSNEELQSTNEELQTTKEEIQATNEELITVNEELKARNSMLARINDDLNNLLSSTNIPIVMVSHDRRIRRFTPSAGRLLNLIDGDIGRPLSHIKPDLEPQVFESLLEIALERLQVEVREVQDRKGNWYQVSVRPYRTSENKIDGAVISIVDIDDLKHAEQQLRAARDYAESIIETVAKPLLVVGDNMRIVSVNRAFATLFGVDEGEVRGAVLTDLSVDWTDPPLQAWLARVMSSEGTDEVIDVRFWPDSWRERVLTVTARPIRRGGDRLFLIAMSDVTLVRQREQREIQLINSVLEVQAREREHLAHELHDETGQALSAVLVGLSTLAKDIGDGRARALLGELRERVRELIDNISRMARGLHPAALEQLGFSGALRQLVEHFSEVHAISVDLDIENEAEFDALSMSLSLGLFRVMQEALTNTARHAEASEVGIALAREGNLIRLRISDDGDGFDIQSQPSAGLGLRLMERRVAQLNGVFRIESAPGMGTNLAIDVPIAAGNEESFDGTTNRPGR
jgi:two-component system CheB/CheR fusion protein